MRRRWGIAAALALALIGCNQQQSLSAGEASGSGPAEKFARSAVAADAPAPAPEAAAPTDQLQQAPPGAPIGGALLAYAYAVALETPADRVEAVMKKHESACVAAGANVCQVLGAGTTSYGAQNIQAQLQLRAEPRWLKTFRDGLEGDAKQAGGRITSSSLSAEDLTRSIVDTEAQLRAQRTLRDRLQALLASRPGKLSDLLDVERELARVQGVIDSTQSNLAVMRARVDMSALTIDYASAGAPVTDRTFAPIREALVDFLRLAAEGVATMIKIAAVALPWVLLVWLIVWAFRAMRRRARKPPPSSASS